MCKPSFKYDNTPMAEAIAECIHNDLHREILHDALINGWSYERMHEQSMASMNEAQTLQQMYKG